MAELTDDIVEGTGTPTPPLPLPKQVSYNVAGARKAGLSEDTIAAFLATKTGYDYERAREAGVTDREIINQLAPPGGPAKSATKPAPMPTLRGDSGAVLAKLKQKISEVPGNLEITYGEMVKGAAAAAGAIAYQDRPANALTNELKIMEMVNRGTRATTRKSDDPDTVALAGSDIRLYRDYAALPPEQQAERYKATLDKLSAIRGEESGFDPTNARLPASTLNPPTGPSSVAPWPLPTPATLAGAGTGTDADLAGSGVLSEGGGGLGESGGLGGRFSTLGRRVAQGVADTIGSGAIKTGQEDIAHAKKLFPTTEEEEKRFSVQAADVFGGLLPYVAGGTIGGMKAVLGYAGTESFAKGQEEALKAGMSPEDALAAGLLEGGTQAALFTIPVASAMKAFIPLPTKAAKIWYIKGLAHMLESGATLTAFSQLSALSTNAVAKSTYDPKRDMMEGVADPAKMGVTMAAGMLLPGAALGARGAVRAADAVTARFRPKPTVADILDRPDVDTAIEQARDFVDAVDPVEGPPARVETAAILDAAQPPTPIAKAVSLFTTMSDGVVERTASGRHQWVTGEGENRKVTPIEIWDEKPTGKGSIEPTTVDAIRSAYGTLGIDVVFIKDQPGIPFDGAVNDRAAPNTIFLSSNPQRAALQVAGHETAHLLEGIKTPGGETIGELLRDHLAENLTPEGWNHAFGLFKGEAPERGRFPAGPEGDAAHIDAVYRHVLTEMAADVSSEVPKLPTFIPAVIGKIEARYGAEAAKGVLRSLIDGLKAAMEKMRSYFTRTPDQSGFETPIHNWLTNVEHFHDLVVDQYTERFGTQIERENAALAAMRDKAQRDRLANQPVDPASVSRETVSQNGMVASPVTGTVPEGIAGRLPEMPRGEPGTEATVVPEVPGSLHEAVAPEPPQVGSPRPAPALGYAEAVQRIATYRRWLGELDAQRREAAPASPQAAFLRQTEAAILGKVNGVEARLTNVAAQRLADTRQKLADLLNPTGDSADMARVRSAIAVEQQRMADAAAVGTGPAPGTVRATEAPAPVPAEPPPVVERGRAVMPGEQPAGPPVTPPVAIPERLAPVAAQQAQAPAEPPVGRPEGPTGAPGPTASSRTASWVIRDKATGEVQFETYDPAKVKALNTEKYEAVPILEYLQEVNRNARESGPAFSPREGMYRDTTFPVSGKEHDLTVNDILDPYRAPAKTRTRSVTEVAGELMARGQTALKALGIEGGRIEESSPRTDRLLARAISSEIAEVFRRDKSSAVDWYTRRVREAMTVAATIHPELATDPHLRFAYTAALAITSQGEVVPSNVRLADTVLERFKKTGRFPTNIVAKEQISMNANFKKLNGLLKTLGEEGTRKFMDAEWTVGELEKMGYEVGGENVDTRVYGSAILGPKIGQGFFQNLNGNYNPVTMDLWFMRAWGRLTGTLVGKVDLSKQRERFENALEAEEIPVPGRMKGLSDLADEIVAQHEADFRKYRDEFNSGERTKSELTNAAQRLQHGISGINQSPTSGGQRNWMRSVIENARKMLEDKGMKLTNADLQAVWWYPEKELYEKLGGRDSDAINVDYADALRALAKKKGIPDAQVEAAVRALDNGPGPAAEADVGGRGGAGRRGSGAGNEGTRPSEGDVSQDLGYVRFSPRQTETPEFKRFFRGSKVADEAGKPLVVHHATWGDFNSFDRARLGENTENNASSEVLAQTARVGFWFSSRNVSEDIGATRSMPVYLAIQKPKVYETLNHLTAAVEGAGGGAELRARLASQGFDGIRVRDEELGGTSFVAFEPTQIKSAIGNRGTFDPSNPDIRFSPKPAEPFYSALLRGVENAKITKATPGQWEGTLRNMPGVKPEERAWVGVDEWLKAQTASVTKEQLADFIRANQIQVREVMKGGKALVTAEDILREDMSSWRKFINEGLHDSTNLYESREAFEADPIEKRIERYKDDFDMRGYERRAEERNKNAPEGATKHSQFVLPGGENYRELLLTLPEKTDSTENFYARNHWDEPNVLAHVRFNDRVIDGKKTLLIEEVQSDWHQKGRKQGYAAKAEPATLQEGYRPERLSAEAAEAVGGREGDWVIVDRDGASVSGTFPATLARQGVIEAYTREMNPGAETNYAVPDAPLKTTWPEFAMKRMIRWAAENGYDKIAWVPGDVQAARYDLSKEVRELIYTGDNRLMAEGRDGRDLINKIVPPEKLADVIGKDVAEKLLAQKPRRGPGDVDDATRHLSGIDLKVGGEGMTAFYDKMLPNITNKLVKKFGTKTERGEIKTPADEDAIMQRAYEIMRDDFPPDLSHAETVKADAMAIEKARTELKDGATQPVHTLDINAAMREGVMQGQPLFSPKLTGENKERTYTPEQKKAFEEMGANTESPTLGKFLRDHTPTRTEVTIAMLDRYAGIKESDPHGYQGMRNANTAAGPIETFMTEGTLKWDGQVLDFKERTGGVKALVKGLGPEAHDFKRWVAGNRAGILKAEGRENLLDDAAIRALKTLNQGTLTEPYTLANGKTTMSREAAYLDALKKYHAINSNVLLDVVVPSGLMTRATAEELLKNPFYVPFYRVDPLENNQFVSPSSTSAAVGKEAFRKLKGGTEKLNNDLWENSDANWRHLIEASLKNKNAIPVLDVAVVNGAAIKRTAQEVAHLSDKAQKADTVWVMKDGVKEYYEIKDPGLFAAVSVLEPISNGVLVRGGKVFKTVLSTGVTMSPGFAARNITRDTQQVLATTPISWNVAGNLYTGFKENNAGRALENWGRAFAGQELKASGMSDIALSAQTSGALMRFSDMVDTGIKQTTMASMLNTPEAVRGFWEKLKTAAEAHRKLLGQSEDVSRIALFKQLKDQGLPTEFAAFSARDIADFTLTGADSLVRTVVAMSAFTNPRMQGLYKVARAAADADRNVALAVGARIAVGMTARVAKVVAAGVVVGLALDAIYADDPDWKNRTEQDKNTNYYFKIGSHEFRIPMGFEVGAVSRLSTIFIESFYDKEMTAGRAAKNAWTIMADNLNLNPIPTAIKPMLEIAMNESSASGGGGTPIVGKGMERLDPAHRYTGSNTLLARGVSAVLNKIPGGLIDPSPIQLDYLVRAYTGWLGTTSLQMGDAAARSFTNEPVRPAEDRLAYWSGGFVSSEPRAQSRYVNMLYEQGGAIERAYATYRDMLSQGQAKEAQEYFQSHKDEITKHGLVSALMRTEAALNKQIRLVSNSADPNMTAEQKKLAIMQLQAVKARAAQQAFGARP